MDKSDQNDIIKKVKSSGQNDNSGDIEDIDNQEDNNDENLDNTDNQEVSDNQVDELNENNEQFILQNPKKLSIFAPKGSKEHMESNNLKETIKNKLKENFNIENNTQVEPTVKPERAPQPTVKPDKVQPEPLRRNKPFLPKPKVQPDPKAGNKNTLIDENTQTGFDINKMVHAYLYTALWTEELESKYDIGNINHDGITKAVKDCQDFVKKAGNLIKVLKPSQVGHDFWLTRNGHGAGFWDGDYPENIGEELTKISKLFGSSDLYIGDDGDIHLS